jgi:hypothetical protein
MGKSENNSPKIDVLIWLVIIVIIGFFAWVVFSYFIQTRTPYQKTTCINNLRGLDAAAQEFALEKGKTNSEAINFPNDLTPYVKLNSAGKIPPCPQGGTYTIKKVGDAPTCSLGTTVNPPHVLP